ncbi:MAG TPA: YcaO-like family protein [Pseudonocardiaceae bacterium]|nr:YcaO-like family protein [Pseudonocardiaceae bacterium]
MSAAAVPDQLSRADVQVFSPFPHSPEVVFGRVAMRSPAFGSTSASGGAPVVIGSAAGDDTASVVLRARGELIERVSNILSGRAAESRAELVASFDDLRRRGLTALDPACWREPGVAALRQAPLLWVPGESLLTRREVLVPAGAAFLHHRPPPGCRAVPRAGSTGVSAHPSPAAAVRHSLLEVLERDLVWRSWYGTGPVTVLPDPPLDPPLDKVTGGLGACATALILPGPGTTAGVVVCLHTEGEREQSFGARCVADRGHTGIRPGVVVAAYEALMVRWSMGTAVAGRAGEEMGQETGALSPRGALEHAVAAFRSGSSLAHWRSKASTDHEAGVVSACTVPEPDLASLLAEHTGEEVVAVDTTTPSARAAGVSVMRVVAPGARPLPAREPAGSGHPPHPFG